MCSGFAPDNVAIEPSYEHDENAPSDIDCLSLTHTYDVDGRIYDVDYYFWDDVTCSTRLPFVCQKTATPSPDGTSHHVPSLSILLITVVISHCIFFYGTTCLSKKRSLVIAKYFVNKHVHSSPYNPGVSS